MICLDASVAVMLIFREEHSAKARSLARNSMTRGEAIVAPHLLPFEVTNAIRQRVRRGEVANDDVPSMVAELFATAITFVPDSRLQRTTLHRRALDLAAQFGLPAAYDAHYLALAEMHGCTFWTADRRLVSAVASGFPLLRWIGDYTAA